MGGAARPLRGGRRLNRLVLARALPRRAASRALGRLAEARAPRPLLRAVLSAYARRFGVDLGEAARPLDEYATFQDFFTRELKAGARPLDPDATALLSPVDGTVYASGTVDAGRVLQAKGVPYRLADLLGSASDADLLDGASYVTAYLSPRDYHRIHWPCDATVERVRHLPGDLWPVNASAVAGVPRLFARNERVAIFARTPAGAPFALVPIGALNVGSIRLAFREIETNRGAPPRPRDVALAPPVRARRGEEAARFAFGSAVALLVSRDAGRLEAPERGSVLRMGRRIGTLAGRSAPG